METHNINLHSKVVFDQAKAKLKTNKVITITGPRTCGKTSLAIRLSSAYQPHQILILKKPEDMKFVNLNHICIIIIDDFAGKYRFEKARACAWLEEFEILNSIVSAGKLNVIITCEETLLQKCCDEFSQHPILENQITLKSEDIVVKRERHRAEISSGDEDVLCNEAMLTDDTLDTAGSSSTEKQSVSAGDDDKQLNQFKRVTHSSEVFYIVEDMCQFEENAVLLLNTTATVTHLNADFEVVQTFETHEQNVEKVCDLGNGSFLIISDKRLSVFDISTGGIERLKSVDINHDCACVDIGEEQDIAILDGNVIYEYDSDLQVVSKQHLTIKNYRAGEDTKVALFSKSKCIVIAKHNCIQTVKFSSRKHFKRSIHFDDIKQIPVAMCSGGEDVFLLCSDRATHLKVRHYSLDLTKLGVLDLNNVHYTPSLTSMLFHRHTSMLLVACSGKLDEWHWDGFRGTIVQNSDKNQPMTSFTDVKKIKIVDLPHNTNERWQNFCQYIDGSYMFVNEQINGDQIKKCICINHFSSDLQHIRQYNSKISAYSSFLIRICCTDTGELVVTWYDKIHLCRINDGTIQLVKSEQLSHMCVSLSFFMNRISCRLHRSSDIEMFDRNLNKKQTVTLYRRELDINEKFIFVAVSNKMFVYCDDFNNDIVLEDTKQKQLKYLREEGFEPLCACAASKESVFVFGWQVGGNNFRILQVNTDVVILTDILVGKEELQLDVNERYKIEFDASISRLILLAQQTKEIREIYLR